MQNTNTVLNSICKMSPVVLFLTLCCIAVVQGSCPTSISEGPAVSLNIQCYRGEAKVTWRSNGDAGIVNLEYNCNPSNGANSQTNQKSNLLDWSESTSGERNITAKVLADNAYKCTVSGCYEDNWYYSYQIPEQSCTFTPEPPTPTSPTSVTATPSSSSLSPSSSPSPSLTGPSSLSLSPSSSPSPSLTGSFSLSSLPSPSMTGSSSLSSSPSPSLTGSPLPSLTSLSSSASLVATSQLQAPIPTPTIDTICCSCGAAAAQLIQAKPTNAPFSKPGIFQVFTDNGTVFICVLAILVLVILLQFIAICALCLQLKSRKKATKGPIAI